MRDPAGAQGSLRLQATFKAQPVSLPRRHVKEHDVRLPDPGEFFTGNKAVRSCERVDSPSVQDAAGSSPDGPCLE